MTDPETHPETHPEAEIIAIGDELLFGDSVDTNSSAIEKRLLGEGVRTRRSSVVGDDAGAIAVLLREAAQRADLVIVTGGLGPTEDDVTREAAAVAAGAVLEERPEALAAITSCFAKLSRTLPAGNRRQAFFPAGAEMIPNRSGTAPGIAMSLGACRLFFLPGVPREMCEMMDGHVLPVLRELFPGAPAVVRRRFRLVGVPESIANRRIIDLMSGDDPIVGMTAHDMVLTLSITSFSPRAEELVEKASRRVRDEFGDRIVGEGEDASLPRTVVELLATRGLDLATAESCTGGLVGYMITSVPGSSAVFREGAVTYTGEAKTRALGVPGGLLDTFGEVSAETARAMAEGAAARTGCRASLAITGIAGPGGGTPEKPVGLVFIAAHLDGTTLCRELRLAGNRDVIRKRSAVLALDLLRRLVLKGGEGEGPPGESLIRADR